MQALQLTKRLTRALFLSSTSRTTILSSRNLTTIRAYALSNLISPADNFTACRNDASLIFSRDPFGSPLSGIRYRGFKTHGSDVKVGNIIQRKDRIYEVTKVDHSHEGRGKATIKVELRDVDSGNKVTQRFGTDESIDRVFVQEKAFMFLCRERDRILLMDPETFEQLEVSEDVFGKAAIYLKDEMKVRVQLYNDTPLSASVPKRVTCSVKEAQQLIGLASAPREKKVVLDNGLTIKVPPYIVVGDVLVIDTTDDTFIERSKA